MLSTRAQEKLLSNGDGPWGTIMNSVYLRKSLGLDREAVSPDFCAERTSNHSANACTREPAVCRRGIVRQNE